MGQQDIVFKLGVDIGGNILGRSPTGAAVLHTLAVLLGVLALAVHHQPDDQSTGDADAEIKQMQAGEGICKGRCEAVRKMQELSRQVGTGGQPVRLPAFFEQVHKNQIWEVEDYQLFHIRLHRSNPLSLTFSLARCLVCSAVFCFIADRTLRMEGRCSLESVFAVNSRNACSRLSASLDLKITT